MSQSERGLRRPACSAWRRSSEEMSKGERMTKRSLRVALGIAAIACLLVVPTAVGADSLGSAPEAAGTFNESTNAWFVELRGAPSVNGGRADSLKSEHAAFKAAAKSEGVAFTQRREFSTLWNGFSVDVSRDKVAALRDIPGVQAVYPVNTVSLPPLEAATDGNGDPDIANAVTMTGADIARTTLGYDGSGIKIAIMDSGVDYALPEFGGGTFPNSKVIGGYDLVGDNYDASTADTTYQPVPHPDSDPAPCDPNVADEIASHPGAGSSSAAHGTHVAGIAAADGRGHEAAGEVTGVAPGAKVLAYRVFGCNGSTDEDVMIEAMERALADGANVLNMSIGSAFESWAGAPTAAAASNLAAAGVVVVASIGNSGTSGLYAAGAPGVGANVIRSGSGGTDDGRRDARHDRGAVRDRRRLRGFRTRQPRRQDRADPARDVHVLPEGVERTGGRRGGSRSLQQRRRRAQPDRGGRDADQDPRGRALRHERERAVDARERRDQRPHVDEPDRVDAAGDREPGLRLHVVRPGRRAEPQAGPRRAGRLDLLDVAPSAVRRPQLDQRHLDVVPARRGRRRALPAGASGRELQRRPDGVPEHGLAASLVRQSGARLPRADLSPGCGHAPDRQGDPDAGVRHTEPDRTRRGCGRHADAEDRKSVV